MLYLVDLVTYRTDWSENARNACRTAGRWVRRGDGMRIDRTIAGAALLAATTVGFASPAWADDFSGKYSVTRSGVTQPGTAPMMWSVRSCGPDCASVTGDEGVRWETHLSNGRWTATLHRPDAVDCKNGTFAPGTSQFSLDAATLRGTIIGTSDGPACGSPTPITGNTVYIVMGQA
jgi:hypothetical protein